MIITYHGHSTFKLKGKSGTVVTDPYHEYIGFSLPKMAADMVTISHDHKDHSDISRITPTAGRKRPFIITENGEYEVGGISVFGLSSFHDGVQGAERGTNNIYTILIDSVRVCHLGDLGHELSTQQLEDIGTIDVLLCPVGGSFTLNPDQAINTIRAIEPAFVIPMHYNTPEHDQDVFGDLKPLETFVTAFGFSPKVTDKLEISGKIQSAEETQLVLLHPMHD